MLLKELLKNIDGFILHGSDEVSISSIEYDSREVKEGSLFIAIKGLKTDGHKYISQALNNNAACIIVEDKECFDRLIMDANVPVVYVRNSSQAMALIANTFFGNPSNYMTLIGITGTNGKTTTSYLLKSIFEFAGKKVGIIGTIGYWIGEEFIPAEKTTPESVKIFEMLKKMKECFVEVVIMEVSSIALELNRVYGLKFDVAAFTNLTQDHLDFHHTFESYFKSKKILFDLNLKSNGIAVYNADDAYGGKITTGMECKKISYGLNQADFRGEIEKISYDGLILSIEHNGVFTKIDSALTGRFNAYNILTAAAISKSLGIDEKTIISGIQNVKNVDGRFKKIKSNSGFWCIVDYSHTPDSLKNALETIRQILPEGSKIITIFGCGGNRDVSKRPVMGKIAQELSDVIIVTSDNPRDEEPIAIIEDILRGITRRENLFIEIDRKEAISRGISLAVKGDVVLVAGKGHENYQEIKGKKIHFDDSEIINKLI